MLFQVFQLVSDRNQSAKYIGTSVGSLLVDVEHFSRCGNLESPDFYKIINYFQLLNILLDRKSVV